MNRSTRTTRRLKQAASQLTKQMNGLSIAPRKRRRNRRGGKGTNKLLPGGVRIVDTEVLSFTDKSATVQAIPFCPGKTTLVRLDNEAAKFRRWSLIRVVINYQPTASLGDSGAITYGILPGPTNGKIAAETDIMKLRPFQKHALWKSSSLTISSNIMIQPHMLTNGTSEDAVGFAIYVSTTDKALGVFKISYDIVLNYPNP